MDTNSITGQIIDSAMRVHTEFGPGLLESAYEHCLVHELRTRGLEVQQQLLLPIIYRGVKIDAGYRLDLLVADTVIVELKAVETMHPIFEAQLLSYLRISGRKVGLLINFHVPMLRDGIKRMVC